MPFINVKLLKGRTVEQKQRFVKAVTQAAVSILKCKPEALTVVFEEFSHDDWYSIAQLPSKKVRES